MLTAELYGKVGPGASNAERLEDVLTSSALSPLRYFGPVAPLMKFLASARNLGHAPLAPAIARDVEVHLWPSVTFSKRTREPDALIELVHDSGARSAIVVEAKYESGPSDIDLEGAGARQDDPVLSGNQLADCYLGARFGRWSFRERLAAPTRVTGLVADRLAVLYITSHYAVPLDVLRQAISAIERRHGTAEANNAREALYWVSWRHLTEMLTDAMAAGWPDLPRGAAQLLEDLRGVLVMRRLEPFSPVFAGLSRVSPVGPLIRREFWGHLLPVRPYVRTLARSRGR